MTAGYIRLRPWTLIVLLLSPLTPVAAQTVARWTFDDDPPGVVTSDLLPGLNGVIVDATRVVGAGEQGLALSFARPSARVDLPETAAYALDGAESFSVLLWVRIARQRAPATLLEARDPKSGVTSYRLGLGDHPGRISLWLWASPDAELVSHHRLDDGLWHYIAAAYDAGSRLAYLFVDDQIEDLAAVHGTGPRTAGLRLGSAWDGSRPFDGDLDDIVIHRGVAEDLSRVITTRSLWTFLNPDDVEQARAAYQSYARSAYPFEDAGSGSAGDWKASRDEAEGPEGAREMLQRLRARFMQQAGATKTQQSPEVTPVGEGIELEGYVLERFIMRTEADVPVPLVIACEEPFDDPEPGPAAILLHGRGKAHLLSVAWQVVTGLVDRGMVVCVADCRAVGELTADWDAPGRAELWAAAYDINCLANWLRAREDVDPLSIALAGFGAAAPAAVAAALQDERIARVAALKIGNTYAVGDRRPHGGRVLEVGDLPQMGAALAPRCLWIQGAEQLSAFAWTDRAYRKSCVEPRFLMTGPPVEDQDLTVWLSAGW